VNITTVVEGAPTVETDSVTNITQTTATSGGDVISEGGSSVTARGVCWSMTQNPTLSDSKTTDGSGTGSFTSDITGLTVNTPYYVRAYATNSSGTCYGNQVVFRTAEACHGLLTVTDSRDGQVYPTVSISSQCWLQKNMNYQTGNSWCYDNNTSNCDTYGRLYDWETALGVCPSGWHLPSEPEFSTLVDFLGGELVAGGKMKSTGTIQSGTGLWKAPNEGATNESGFTAFPAGEFWIAGSEFRSLGVLGSFWSSTEFTTDPADAWNVNVWCDVARVDIGRNNKMTGESVRCLKD